MTLGNRRTNRSAWPEQIFFLDSKGILIMMVIYLPVKFEFDWTNRFRVKSPETKNVDGQTDGQKMDK